VEIVLGGPARTFRRGRVQGQKNRPNAHGKGFCLVPMFLSLCILMDPFDEQMSTEQLGQLYEVMHVTKDIWKPVEDLDIEEKKP
jgi:hypothetical protein